MVREDLSDNAKEAIDQVIDCVDKIQVLKIFEISIVKLKFRIEEIEFKVNMKIYLQYFYVYIVFYSLFFQVVIWLNFIKSK